MHVELHRFLGNTLDYLKMLKFSHLALTRFGISTKNWSRKRVQTYFIFKNKVICGISWTKSTVTDWKQQQDCAQINTFHQHQIGKLFMCHTALMCHVFASLS